MSAWSATEESDEMNAFDVVRVVGVGGFGKVQQVYWRKHDLCVAIKTYDERALLCFRAELKVLRKAKHPFIIQHYKSFITADNCLHLVLQYCPGGDLHTRLTRLSAPLTKGDALFYATEVVSALHALHTRRVLHGDLKLENVLLTGDGHIVLADFGSASTNVREWNAGVFGFYGSEAYMPPEHHYQLSVGLAADVWTLGCLLYELFTCQPVPAYNPFMGDVPFTSLLVASIDAELQDLLSHLLQEDPTQRFTTEQVRAHALFSGVDWVAVEAKTWRAPPWVPSAGDITFDASFTSLPVMCYAPSCSATSPARSVRTCY
jgi:serine/threonine protein kinase